MIKLPLVLGILLAALVLAAVVGAAWRAGDHVELRESAWSKLPPEELWPHVERVDVGKVVERERPWLIVRHAENDKHNVHAVMLAEEGHGTRVDWIVRASAHSALRRLELGVSVRAERRALRRELRRLAHRRTPPPGDPAR